MKLVIVLQVLINLALLVYFYRPQRVERPVETTSSAPRSQKPSAAEALESEQALERELVAMGGRCLPARSGRSSLEPAGQVDRDLLEVLA
ncbi:MAG: hypothetical protein AAF533_20340 [Acidobacteriota bacterium]